MYKSLYIIIIYTFKIRLKEISIKAFLSLFYLFINLIKDFYRLYY